MKITKIFTFDSSHMLDGHDGKCHNLHGHTYKLEVQLSDGLITSGAKEGMVMDFTDVKNVVKQHIINHFDHAFIYDERSEREAKIAAMLESWQMKTMRLPFRTTAENMAIYMFHTLKANGLPMSMVRLWETPTSYCEYCGEEE